MLPHLLFFYIHLIFGRDTYREREKEQKKKKGQGMELHSDWNKLPLFSLLCEWTRIRLPHLSLVV
jgi:hypothetical protein